MNNQYTKVVCVRISEATYDKLLKLQQKDQKLAEVLREAIINGVARMEVEHVKTS